jgi:hypothetical protein
LTPESDRTLVISVTTTPVVAHERFALNGSQNASIRIVDIDGIFKEWFLNKIEEPAATKVLRASRLCNASKDGPIIAELGGEKKAESTLTKIFACMELQADGKRQPLLTNRHENIFYVRDQYSPICGSRRFDMCEVSV